MEQVQAGVNGNWRDSAIIGCVFLCITFALPLDGSADLAMQGTMGICAWFLLAMMLLGEQNMIRAQVVVAIIFATIGEYFASVYLGVYTYRLENVPAYVPPGHGMVYLAAVVMARQRLFVLYRQQITWFVLASGGLWSVWGVFFAERGDVGGAVLFVVFMICVYKGRSPLIYLGAFFVTTWLEIVGTYYGTWYWAVFDPVTGLSQGNPPSGVAVWYVIVDAVAIALASILIAKSKGLYRRIITKRGAATTDSD